VITLCWFAPRYHYMRFQAKQDGSYGSATYRKMVTTWQAEYSRVITKLFQIIMRLKIEARVEDHDAQSGFTHHCGLHIVPGKSHIIISNHISWFDAVCYPSLCASIGLNDVRYVVKESALKHPIAYPFLTISWDEARFPAVTRTNPEYDLKEIHAKSLIALHDGASMLTFCEGTRQPNDIIGTPKWKGFAEQEKIFHDCNIVSLTQCLDRPVGKTIWLGHTYFLRSIILNVHVRQPLTPEIDRRTWLEQEFASKAELIRAARTQAAE